MRARSCVVAVVAAVVVVALAGCSTAHPSTARAKATKTSAFGDLTGRQIAEATAAALKKVTSVHVEGASRYDGEKVHLEVAADRDGVCAGSVDLKAARFEFIHAKDGRWIFKGNAPYWRAYGPRKHKAEVALRLGDRWVLLSTRAASRQLGDMCDLDWQWEEIIPGDTAKCVKGGTNVHSSEELVEVMCGHTLVSVQAGDPHWPVRYHATHGEDLDDVVLDDFNKPVEPDLPPADKVLDLSDSEVV
jgi:hypothetical protein